MNSVKDFRGKIEPPVEKGVLKIERYAQRLTQGYNAYGGSYLWAPDLGECRSSVVRHVRVLNDGSFLDEKSYKDIGCKLC